MRVFVSCLLFLIILPAPTLADLAPMQNKAYCFTTVTSSDIRMARETVDIRIGDRISEEAQVRWVRVDARFFMRNETPDTVVIDVGFPISTMWFGQNRDKPDSERMAASLEEISEQRIYDFNVTVDSGETIRPDPAIVVGAFNHSQEQDYIWFGWATSFPPGETVVDVTYNVTTHHTYARLDQQALYILGTGRYWKDSIGEATVRVHLPSECREHKLISALPRGYVEQDTVLTWYWTDYEPSVHDVVSITVYPPETLSELRRLEKGADANPEDMEKLITLVKKYLAAAYHKGPERLSNHPDFAKLAEIRLEKILEIDPSNAEVWHLYLNNYYRMYKNCFGVGWHSMFEIYGNQRLLVESAYLNCPGDEGVRIWNDLIQESVRQPPEIIGYQIVYYDDLPWVELNDFYRSIHPIIRKHEEKILDKYYKRTTTDTGGPMDAGGPILKLKKKKLTETDRRKIVQILERRFFYRYENWQRIYKYYHR